MKEKIDVIFEDNHLIAVNKRAGDLSQRDNTRDNSLIEKIKNYIKIKYSKPGEVFLGAIHRLDRPTSGVIIYARTSKALSRMTNIFKARLVDKKYLALVDSRPPDYSGILSNYLKKNVKKNKSFVCSQKTAGGKLAELSYKIVQNIDKFYLLEIDLHTGRHHQIRAQLANIGCKIVGDLKYGYPIPNSDKSICLHCKEISFEHPVAKTAIRITASIPKTHEWLGIS